MEVIFFLSGDNPDLLYQELASDNELEKSVHDGGNLKLIFVKTEIASTQCSLFYYSWGKSMCIIKLNIHCFIKHFFSNRI